MNSRKPFLAEKGWHLCFVPDEDGQRRLNKQVYCTTRIFPDSVDIYVDELDNDQEEQRNDIEELSRCTSTEISSAELRQYPSTIDEGTKFYCVWSKISIRILGRNVTVPWDRAPPSFRVGGRYFRHRLTTRTDYGSRRWKVQTSQEKQHDPNDRVENARH